MNNHERKVLAGLCRIEIRRWRSLPDKQYMVDLMEVALEALTTEPSLRVPDGWRLVPLIAFPSQWAAGQKAFDSSCTNKVDAVYKAMVAATPNITHSEVGNV